MESQQLLEIERGLAELRAQVKMHSDTILRLDKEVEMMRSQAHAGAVALGEMRAEMRQLIDVVNKIQTNIENNAQPTSDGHSLLWDVVKIILTALFTLGLTAIWYVASNPPT